MVSENPQVYSRKKKARKEKGSNTINRGIGRTKMDPPKVY